MQFCRNYASTTGKIILPNFDAEISLEKPVIGVDEVGRGPLAGPVVSCACIFFDYSLPKDKLIIIDDSKKLNRTERLKALKLIFECVVCTEKKPKITSKNTLQLN